MEKNLNLFYADVLRKRTLTDEQSMALQEMLFPGLDEDPNRARMESVKDMTAAFTKWEMEQSKKTESEKPLPPMSDEEVDELARLL